jgi:curved DNA-binding protein CbpA
LVSGGKKTHYDVLGVRVESNAEVIHKAWRLAAWENHPDLRSDEERALAEERMQAINEAYQVLSNPRSRRRYDLENGLIAATCGSCGKPGRQRLSSTNTVVAVCEDCWSTSVRVIAL